MGTTDIFISYARADRGSIAHLADVLKANGFSVWWDRELLAGDRYADEIERALEAASTVIVAWSATSVKSRWVKDEASVAADDGKLIAISVDGTPPPLGFRQFHCADVRVWQGTADETVFVDLARSIRSRLNAEASAVTAVPAAPAASPAAAAPEDSSNVVAVLPFVNRSSQSDDAYFADGVHDELLTRLAKLRAFLVISRTSVLRFRDTDKSIPQIAKDLGAAVVLEGSVQRAGPRVRINVQLIDGLNDTHMWAENFDRDLTPENLFDIQTEIALVIAAELETALTGADEEILQEAAPTENLAAYDLYLRGKLLARSEAAGEREIRAAIEAFDQAIAADPSFAEPHAAKARAQLTMYWFFGWDSEWVEAAAAAVDKARTLAPDSIETLLAVAYYHYWGRLEYEPAVAALDQVLRRAPNDADAWACRAYVVRRAGRFEESIDALRKALRLDPMLVDLSMELAETLATFGRFDEAGRLMGRVDTLAGDSPFTAYFAGDAGYLAGQADEAWAGASRPVSKPDFVYAYRRAFHALHTRDPVRISRSIDDWPDHLKATPSFPETFDLYRAMALLATGRDDEGGKLLARIKARRDAAEDAYPGGWVPDAPYFPVTLPGLLGDLDAVRAMAKDYEANSPLDEFGKVNHFHSLASAFARCGDRQNALGYLQRLVDLYGPSAYLPMTITPAYDDLRNEPAWDAMRTRYEAWARTKDADRK